MHATVLNGFAETTPFSDEIVKAFTDTFIPLGWTIETVELGKLTLAACRGCFGCWIKTPGECVIDDEARNITRKMIQSNLIVYLSPITFGGYSSTLKQVLDRSIGILHPYFKKVQGEYHHQKRYDLYPDIVGLGTLPESDDEMEDVFRKLVHRNSLNMHCSKYATGILYENQETESIQSMVGEVLATVGVH